jgi:hypothetical protein
MFVFCEVKDLEEQVCLLLIFIEFLFAMFLPVFIFGSECLTHVEVFEWILFE